MQLAIDFKKPTYENQFKARSMKNPYTPDTLIYRVLQMLLMKRVVTTSEFCSSYLYTFRSRIPEIEKDGIKIYRRKIQGKPTYEYSLWPFDARAI